MSLKLTYIFSLLEQLNDGRQKSKLNVPNYSTPNEQIPIKNINNEPGSFRGTPASMFTFSGTSKYGYFDI